MLAVAAVPAPRAASPVPYAARRTGAALVDLALAIGAAGLIAALADVLMATGPDATSAGGILDVAAVLVVLSVPAAWFLVGEGRTGATVGKRLAGLEVTDASGGRVGWARAALRLMLRLSPVGLIGVLWAAASGTEPWHDRWSGTRVVDRGAHRAAAPGRPALRLVPPRSPSRAAIGRTERRPQRAPVPLRPVTSARGDVGAGSPAPPASCRCSDLPRLNGPEAVSYALGHLLAVRRWPRAGCFALVCPSTRVAWMAHDDWADRSGQATLVRLAALPDPPLDQVALELD